MHKETFLIPTGDAVYAEQIRAIIAAHGRLQVDVEMLDDDADLYQAGLTSLSTVNLMLALEEAFDVEFLDRMLKRRTFQSIHSLSDAVAELVGASIAATAAPAPVQELRAGA